LNNIKKYKMSGFNYNKVLITCSLLVALFAINSCSPVLKLSSGRKIESTCNPDQQYHIFSEFYNFNNGYNIIDRIHTQRNFFRGYNITKSIDLLESGVCILKGNALKNHQDNKSYAIWVSKLWHNCRCTIISSVSPI
jgi:hypothetical protein